MGTVRRQIFIEAPADAVWGLVGDPARLNEWFPVTESHVSREDGRTDLPPTLRRISLASGLNFDEKIVTLDHDLRRFQYSIIGNPIITSHLGTVDVIGDGEHRCLVVYSTDLDPEPMALVIAGAAGEGLHRLKNLFESSASKTRSGAT